MKRTTTTTHRYDAGGKVIETVVVETVEDESVPNVQPYVSPYTYPQVLPYPTTYPWITYTSGGYTSGGYASGGWQRGAEGVNAGGGGTVTPITFTIDGQTFAQNVLPFVRPDDDDGTAGVPAVV